MHKNGAFWPMVHTNHQPPWSSVNPIYYSAHLISTPPDSTTHPYAWDNLHCLINLIDQHAFGRKPAYQEKSHNYREDRPLNLRPELNLVSGATRQRLKPLHHLPPVLFVFPRELDHIVPKTSLACYSRISKTFIVDVKEATWSRSQYWNAMEVKP